MSLTFPALVLVQAAAGRNPLIPLLIQMGAIFAIFYFLMIRPQQKQRKQHEERLRNLRKGDSIVTGGGIVAEVVHIKETQVENGKPNPMEDHVTVKSGESRFIVERGRIARVMGTSGTAGPAS